MTKQEIIDNLNKYSKDVLIEAIADACIWKEPSIFGSIKYYCMKKIVDLASLELNSLEKDAEDKLTALTNYRDYLIEKYGDTCKIENLTPEERTLYYSYLQAENDSRERYTELLKRTVYEM